MDRAAFTAMTGAKYAVDLLSVTSNNLANAGTAGFREQLSYFRSVPLEGEGAPTRTFAMSSLSVVNRHTVPASSGVSGVSSESIDVFRVGGFNVSAMGLWSEKFRNPGFGKFQKREPTALPPTCRSAVNFLPRFAYR